MGLDPVITMAVQVIRMPWNERSRWSGLADHDAVESVATIAWRAQLAKLHRRIIGDRALVLPEEVSSDRSGVPSSP